MGVVLWYGGGRVLELWIELVTYPGMEMSSSRAL